MKEGKLIVFTAPSGAGKTTIVKHLLKNRQQLAFSISATTRSQRYGEVNGMDYYFITLEKFNKKRENDEFLEWEEVYENQFYGTLKSEIHRLWKTGKHVIFDIDVKGAWRIKKKYGDKALCVFVKPPSSEILFSRLKARKTEDVESLRKRISRASEELTFENKFDISLVNDNLEVALKEAEQIVDNFLSGNLKAQKVH